MSDSRVVRDKLVVEVGKAKERSYILDFSGGWSSGNSIEFDWVHDKLTGFHNHPEVFNLKDVKLAFFEL